VHYVLHVLNVI